MTYSEADIKYAESLSEDEILDMIKDYVMDNELTMVRDGCYVEGDGQCEHGCVSPLRVLGLT